MFLILHTAVQKNGGAFGEGVLFQHVVFLPNTGKNSKVFHCACISALMPMISLPMSACGDFEICIDTGNSPIFERNIFTRAEAQGNFFCLWIVASCCWCKYVNS